MSKKSGGESNSELRPDDLRRLHLWQIQAVRDVAVLAAVVFLVLCGYWLRSVTVPLLIALALAYLFEPVVVWATRKYNISRTTVAGSLVAAVGLLFAVAVLGVALSLVQTVDLVRSLPERAGGAIQLIDEHLPAPIGESLLQGLHSLIGDETASDPATTGEPATPADDGAAPSNKPDDHKIDSAGAVDATEIAGEIRSWLRANLGTIFQATVRTTGDALSVILQFVSSTVYIAFTLFLIPFYFFAFSTGWPHLRDMVVEVFPVQHSKGVYDMLKKMDAAVSGFVRGRIVICAIMGVLFAVGWWMCGVPYWLLLGILTGVFSIVPYLGGVGLPLAIGLLWLGQGDLPPDARMAWWGIILWPTIVFTIVQLLEGYGLTPMIAGKATNLGPVSILVAVLAGGAVGGVYGMLLAIPAAACIKILVMDLLLPRVKKYGRGEAADMLPISGD